MTSKAPLCLRLGIALLHRAKAWEREAVAAGEIVVARVNAATSGNAAERKGAEQAAAAAAITAGGGDVGAATVTELLHTAYLLEHLRSVDGMHAQFIGTQASQAMAATAEGAPGAAGALGAGAGKKGAKDKTSAAQLQVTKRQQEKATRAAAAAVAAADEWSSHLHSVREEVVAALGKQLIASHLSRWDAAPPPPDDARAAALIREHYRSSDSAGIRRLVDALCPDPNAHGGVIVTGKLAPEAADVDALLDAMHLHALVLPSLSMHWRDILKHAVNRAKTLSQPPQALMDELLDPNMSNTKKRRALVTVKEGTAVRARYLAHAGLLIGAPTCGGKVAQPQARAMAAITRAGALVRLAHTLNSQAPSAAKKACDAAGEAIVDAASIRRATPGAWPLLCWYGNAPRPATSVAMLEEALTLVCATMLPNTVLPLNSNPYAS